MPEAEIRSQLRKLDLGKLQDLKREWGVSMQALIERAYGLNLLTPAWAGELLQGAQREGMEAQRARE